MSRLKTLLVGCAALLLSLPVLATDTPSDLAGATIVQAEKVRELISGGAKIFDVRKATEFAEEHIPGAINLVYKEESKKEASFDASLDKFNLETLGADKNAPLIFQCNGADCWKSYKASWQAVKAGYKKVFWFRGGIPEWKKKGFGTEK